MLARQADEGPARGGEGRANRQIRGACNYTMQRDIMTVMHIYIAYMRTYVATVYVSLLSMLLSISITLFMATYMHV